MQVQVHTHVKFPSIIRWLSLKLVVKFQSHIHIAVKSLTDEFTIREGFPGHSFSPDSFHKQSSRSNLLASQVFVNINPFKTILTSPDRVN